MRDTEGSRRRPAESLVGRYTAKLHLRAAALDGLAAGVLLLNEFVAVKALEASLLGVAVLLMLPTVAQLLNLYWTGTSGGDPRRVFLWVGIAPRLALLAVPWVGGASSFIVLAAIAATATTVMIPAQNGLYQANYAPHERGRLYARVTALSALVTVTVTTVLGSLYDRDESLFRVAYPVAGAASALAAIFWYRIRWRHRGSVEIQPAPSPAAVASVPRPAASAGTLRLARGVTEPFRAAVRLFAEDRDFLRFEMAFMTYGLAFMMLQPVLPLFLVRELGVDYSQASQAKGLLFFGTMIAALPFAGKLNDRIGPIRLAGFCFLLLAVFPAILVAAHGIALVYLAYGVFGAAMSGISVTWTLGPLTLAGERSAARYMGAHVALVGVRGLIGYPLGMALMDVLSARAVFVCAAILEIGAAILMLGLARQREGRTVAAGVAGG